MVSKGEFLERPALVPNKTDVLEGLWHRGDKKPPCLLVPPLPSQGSMDHVVLAEMAWALAMAGHATLRFNFRGVGASQGERGNTKACLDDARAALKLLLENTGARVAVVAGVLSGADVALGLGGKTVAGRILLNPPTLPRKQSGAKRLLVLLTEDAEDGRALEDATRKLGGVPRVVSGSDVAFRKGLPEFGRLAAEWCAGLA
ncbi:MAG: serine aminopeptidase domain-containing protein [Myxococcaceae bacterium]